SFLVTVRPPTDIYTLSLHDALPIFALRLVELDDLAVFGLDGVFGVELFLHVQPALERDRLVDRLLHRRFQVVRPGVVCRPMQERSEERRVGKAWGVGGRGWVVKDRE